MLPIVTTSCIEDLQKNTHTQVVRTVQVVEAVLLTPMSLPFAARGQDSELLINVFAQELTKNDKQVSLTFCNVGNQTTVLYPRLPPACY